METLYNCAYPYCLHKDEKIDPSDAVKIGRKYFHRDCAIMRQEIKDAADIYINIVNDKKLYPVAIKIINTMVFKNKVPISYIKTNLESSGEYYIGKPVQVLYGLRKLFWEKEFRR